MENPLYWSEDGEVSNQLCGANDPSNPCRKETRAYRIMKRDGTDGGREITRSSLCAYHTYVRRALESRTGKFHVCRDRNEQHEDRRLWEAENPAESACP